MAFKFTEEQLNTLDKSFIVNLFLQLQDQNDKLSGEVQELNKKMEVLIEQITLANKNRFGRSSEKTMDTSQICFMEVDGTIVFFNEAEAISDLDAEEPDTLENKPARKPKTVGKKEADIKDLPVNIINHYLTDEELVAEFGENGWKQLPDAISKHYRFIPAKVEIDEHHVGVYASKTDDRIIKADHPKALLHGSLVSPTIAAAIMNGKYVNAVPLYRLEQEFSRYGLAITRQNMANWMIRLGESYLAVLYDYLHKKLYDYHVIQADETPVRYQDVYHKALCYCLGISDDTRRNINRIYDFKTGCVKPECLHDGWQTSGSEKVVRMAFNLYCNGTPSVDDELDAEEQIDECRRYSAEDLFCCCYAPFFWQAIQIRYE